MIILRVTATGLAFTGKAIVEGVSLIPAAADATVILNDSLTGSDAANDKGAIKAELEYSSESCLYGQPFNTGIYVTLTGAGAVAFIYLR